MEHWLLNEQCSHKKTVKIVYWFASTNQSTVFYIMGTLIVNGNKVYNKNPKESGGKKPALNHI